MYCPGMQSITWDSLSLRTKTFQKILELALLHGIVNRNYRAEGKAMVVQTPYHSKELELSYVDFWVCSTPGTTSEQHAASAVL